MVEPLAETDALERGDGQSTRITFCAAAVVQQRQLDVLHRARPRQKIEALKHEPEFLVSDRGQFVLAESIDANAIEQIRARSRRIEATEKVHQSRLTGS